MIHIPFARIQVSVKYLAKPTIQLILWVMHRCCGNVYEDGEEEI